MAVNAFTAGLGRRGASAGRFMAGRVLMGPQLGLRLRSVAQGFDLLHCGFAIVRDATPNQVVPHTTSFRDNKKHTQNRHRYQ